MVSVLAVQLALACCLVLVSRVHCLEKTGIGRDADLPIQMNIDSICTTSKSDQGLCIRPNQCYFRAGRAAASGGGSPYSFDDMIIEYVPCGYIIPGARRFVGVCCSRRQLGLDEDSTHVPNWARMGGGKLPTTKYTPPADWFEMLGVWRPGGPTSPSSATERTRFPNRPVTTRFPPTTKTRTTPKVRVPSTTTVRTSTSTAPQLCKVKNNKACGKSGYEFKIVNGTQISPNSQPWLTGILRTKGSRPGLFCGGSLITRQHVLSAAHCFGTKPPDGIKVRLGAHNLTDKAENSIVIEVEKVTVHSKYRSHPAENDIAILKLKTPVELGDKIRLVCLDSDKSETHSNRKAFAVGWGKVNFYNRTISQVPNTVEIPVHSPEDCRSLYKPILHVVGKLDEKVVCAGEKWKDSCVGDSGGPLMIPDGPNEWTQIGVVSWGVRCGVDVYPGVYTRVSKFIDWIEENLDC